MSGYEFHGTILERKESELASTYDGMRSANSSGASGVAPQRGSRAVRPEQPLEGGAEGQFGAMEGHLIFGSEYLMSEVDLKGRG